MSPPDHGGRGYGPALGAVWVLVLYAALVAAASASQTARAAKGPAAVVAAPPDTEVQRLVRRHDAAQVVVLKEQICLQTPRCLTDEGRLLDAMETVKRVNQALADLAQGGDAQAAYERGLIALRAAQTHAGRSALETDLQFPGAALILRRRWAQETSTAEKYLSMAAMQSHPPACLALAEHMAQRAPQPEAPLVARLFRCAVVGFSDRGDRAAAIHAFAKMREACRPMDPLLVEAHAVIYRESPPDRPWRQVEPDEALALRNQRAP
jgi:hypothetical protein